MYSAVNIQIYTLPLQKITGVSEGCTIRTEYFKNKITSESELIYTNYFWMRFDQLSLDSHWRVFIIRRYRNLFMTVFHLKYPKNISPKTDKDLGLLQGKSTILLRG